MFDYMPEQASTWAGEVDWLNNFITNISVFCTLGLTGIMLFFAFKYRRKSPNQKTAYITHSSSLEILWTAIPTVVVIFTFYFGYATYSGMRSPPPNALEVMVDAQKWRWEFQHANGKKATNELVVPIGRAVRLVMTSHDVLHSLFIPAMRVKEDVRGDAYSYLWFTATKLGEYPIFCAEYCGLDHSGMLAKLRVVSEAEYQDHINERSEIEVPPLELGAKLFKEKSCVACHSIDGSVGQGPSLKGIFSGTKEHEFSDGTKIKVDENYVRESLLTPNAKVVKGFPPNIMPVFQGQLNEKQIQGIIAYLKTL